jgi:hypothetical protein
MNIKILLIASAKYIDGCVIIAEPIAMLIKRDKVGRN